MEAGYQALIARDPERWSSFDARKPIEELAEEILVRVEPELRRIRMLEVNP